MISQQEQMMVLTIIMKVMQQKSSRPSRQGNYIFFNNVEVEEEDQLRVLVGKRLFLPVALLPLHAHCLGSTDKAIGATPKVRNQMIGPGDFDSGTRAKANPRRGKFGPGDFDGIDVEEASEFGEKPKIGSGFTTSMPMFGYDPGKEGWRGILTTYAKVREDRSWFFQAGGGKKRDYPLWEKTATKNPLEKTGNAEDLETILEDGRIYPIHDYILTDRPDVPVAGEYIKPPPKPEGDEEEKDEQEQPEPIDIEGLGVPNIKARARDWNRPASITIDLARGKKGASLLSEDIPEPPRGDVDNVYGEWEKCVSGNEYWYYKDQASGGDGEPGSDVPNPLFKVQVGESLEQATVRGKLYHYVDAKSILDDTSHKEEEELFDMDATSEAAHLLKHRSPCRLALTQWGWSIFRDNDPRWMLVCNDAESCFQQFTCRAWTPDLDEFFNDVNAGLQETLREFKILEDWLMQNYDLDVDERKNGLKEVQEGRTKILAMQEEEKARRKEYDQRIQKDKALCRDPLLTPGTSASTPMFSYGIESLVRRHLADNDQPYRVWSLVTAITRDKVTQNPLPHIHAVPLKLTPTYLSMTSKEGSKIPIPPEDLPKSVNIQASGGDRAAKERGKIEWGTYDTVDRPASCERGDNCSPPRSFETSPTDLSVVDGRLDFHFVAANPSDARWRLVNVHMYYYGRTARRLKDAQIPYWQVDGQWDNSAYWDSTGKREDDDSSALQMSS
ncbi:unnamed protein product, partial [Amoebophrya sp. A25]|eukprot:GSA25T00007372001.1